MLSSTPSTPASCGLLLGNSAAIRRSTLTIMFVVICSSLTSLSKNKYVAHGFVVVQNRHFRRVESSFNTFDFLSSSLPPPLKSTPTASTTTVTAIGQDEDSDEVEEDIDFLFEEVNEDDIISTSNLEVSERVWRYVKKPLLRIGVKGATLTHGNSLRQLLEAHTVVKVKVNTKKFDGMFMILCKIEIHESMNHGIFEWPIALPNCIRFPSAFFSLYLCRQDRWQRPLKRYVILQ